MVHFMELHSAASLADVVEAKHQRPLNICIDDQNDIVQFYLPGSTQRATFSSAEAMELCNKIAKLIDN